MKSTYNPIHFAKRGCVEAVLPSNPATNLRWNSPATSPRNTSLVAIHVPVLLRETLQGLDLRPGLTVVDGTIGGGGHSRKILEQIQPTGILIGLDRDPLMLQHAATVVTDARSLLCHASYRDLPTVLGQQNIAAVDRILVDLGLSSDQLADRARGFGFNTSGPLDMRFDVTQGESAAELLSRANSEELATIFYEFGEERFSRQIADQIVRQRRGSPITTAADLVAAIDSALPASIKREARRGTSHTCVSSSADRGQSRTGTLGTRTDSQFVRLIAARGTAGSDHVSFVGRPIGQTRFSG